VQALAAGATLTDTITFTSDDGSTQTQTITITGTNDAAVIGGDTTAAVSEDGILSDSGALTISDADSGEAVFVAQSSAASTNGYGTVDLDSAGNWTYNLDNTNATVQALSEGETLTDSFTATSADGSTQVVSVTIIGKDDKALITGNTSFIGDEGDTVIGDLNATDVEGLTDGTYFTVSAQPTHGQAKIDPATGTWKFAPNDPEWFGSDQFTVLVTDDKGGTTEQVISITLANVDDAAVIIGDVSYSGNEGDTVTGDLNATDADGLTDGTYFTVTSPATNGTATIDVETGVWSFVPTDANWFGTDQFTVTVTDDEGGTTEQVISITLANMDDAAVITGDVSYSGNEGDAVSGDLNATDADGLTDGTYFTVTAQSANGIAAIDAETGDWTFTPTDANWYGTDQFTVTVTDDEGGTTEQVISITLANVNDAPVTTPVTLTAIAEDSGARVITQNELLANSSDIDGDILVVTGLGVSTGSGALVDNNDGTWTFTPAANWNGEVSFNFEVTDGTTAQASSAALTVTPVNDAPIGSVSLTGTPTPGQTLTVSSNLADADGMGEITYIWKADGVTVGAGTAYTLTQEEVGKVMTVEASYIDGAGSVERVASVATAPVAYQAMLEPLPESEQERDPEPEQEPELAAKPVPTVVAEAESVPVEDQSEITPSGIQYLSPIDDAVLAESLTEVYVMTDKYDYDNDPHEVPPPKSLDLLNLHLTPFQFEGMGAVELISPLNNSSFSGGLDDMKRDLDRVAEEEAKHAKFRTEAMVGATMGLSVGFISWVLRAGSLMAGFMSITPLWRQLDPMPILGSGDKKDQKKDQDDEANDEGRNVEEIFADEESDR
uniref:tandem-95 repeat protein n=1 Tax=Marinobacter sp. TaxID=50741 RepID=UPI003A94C77F